MKNKKGSFSDRRFENGGQCGCTYPSHIFRECPGFRGRVPKTLPSRTLLPVGYRIKLNSFEFDNELQQKRK